MPKQYTKEELMDKLCFEVIGVSRADSPTSDEVILNDAIVILRNRKQHNNRAEEKITQLEEQLEAKEAATFTPQDLLQAAGVLGAFISDPEHQVNSNNMALYIIKVTDEIARLRKPK